MNWHTCNFTVTLTQMPDIILQESAFTSLKMCRHHIWLWIFYEVQLRRARLLLQTRWPWALHSGFPRPGDGSAERTRLSPESSAADSYSRQQLAERALLSLLQTQFTFNPLLEAHTHPCHSSNTISGYNLKNEALKQWKQSKNEKETVIQQQCMCMTDRHMDIWIHRHS